MKFIKRHTPGPWEHIIENQDHMSIKGFTQRFECIRPVGGDDYSNLVRTSGGRDNIKLMAMAPDMIDYIIERAEWLNSNMEHYWNSVPHRQELEGIIAILRAAGVEVVEV